MEMILNKILMGKDFLFVKVLSFLYIMKCVWNYFLHLRNLEKFIAKLYINIVQLRITQSFAANTELIVLTENWIKGRNNSNSERGEKLKVGQNMLHPGVAVF
jgi:hypothetical protein